MGLSFCHQYLARKVLQVLIFLAQNRICRLEIRERVGSWENHSILSCYHSQHTNRYSRKSSITASLHKTLQLNIYKFIYIFGCVLMCYIYTYIFLYKIYPYVIVIKLYTYCNIHNLKLGRGVKAGLQSVEGRVIIS